MTCKDCVFYETCMARGDEAARELPEGAEKECDFFQCRRGVINMYKSPIDIIYGEVQKALEKEAKELDNAVMTEIRKIGININKEELVKALQYDREQYQKGYNDGLSANKWISVDDGLPKDREWVLVWHTGYATPKKAKHKDDGDPFMPIFILDGYAESDGEVTHWMPLPEPPKERRDT